MVQHLSGIIEDSSVGSRGYDGFYCFSFIFGARNQAIEIVYICLKMFTIMVIDGLLTDYRFQRIVCVRKLGIS